MGRFDIDEKTEREWAQRFKDAVQPNVDEEVLAVGPFRRGGFAAQYAVSKMQLGAAVYGAASAIRKKRAGGLPDNFLLAVTPTKVHAFKFKQGRKGVKLQDEVATWDRSSIVASAEREGGAAAVTIEVPDEGQTHKIAAGGIAGVRNPWADAVMKLLEDPKKKRA